MKKRKNYKTIINSVLSITFSLIFIFETFSNDFVMPSFNGIIPNNYIHRTCSQKRLAELSGNAIRYEYIDDMVHLYNADVLSNWNEFDSDKSSQDIYDDYQDAADSLSNGGGDSEMQDGMLKAQADAMRIQADKNVRDSYTDFLNYYSIEENTKLATKLAYINYLKSEYDVRIALATAEEKARNLNSVKLNFEVGNATKVEVLNAESGYCNAEAQVMQAETARNAYRRTVIINCGKSIDENIDIIHVLPTVENEIANINFNSDLEKALVSNVQFEIYKRNKENAQTTEVKNEADININSAPQKIKSDIDAKYNDLVMALETTNNLYSTLNLAENKEMQERNHYERGSISAKEYQTVVYNLELARCEYDKSKYDILLKYESYIASVNGLASG